MCVCVEEVKTGDCQTEDNICKIHHRSDILPLYSVQNIEKEVHLMCILRGALLDFGNRQQ